MISVEPQSSLYLITAPAAGENVVTLEAMKLHLRVDASDDDDAIVAYRDAAIAHIDGRDGWLGRALLDQTWELRLSSFPSCGFIRIPLPPLIEIVSINYIDEDDAEQTIEAANYHVTGEGNRGGVSLVSGGAWPTLAAGFPEPVIVRFRAGYIDSSVSPAIPAVPKPIIQAIKLFTGSLYENRETIVVGTTAIQLPWSATALLAPYRVWAH